MKVAGEFEAEAQVGEGVRFALDRFTEMVTTATEAVPNLSRRKVKLYFEVSEA